jgi:hypothetical protein
MLITKEDVEAEWMENSILAEVFCRQMEFVKLHSYQNIDFMVWVEGELDIR